MDRKSSLSCEVLEGVLILSVSNVLELIVEIPLPCNFLDLDDEIAVSEHDLLSTRVFVWLSFNI